MVVKEATVIKSDCDLTCREQWGWMFTFFGQIFCTYTITSTDTILPTYEFCHAIDRQTSKVYKKAEAGKYA
jgi:hypothetical protein